MSRTQASQRSQRAAAERRVTMLSVALAAVYVVAGLVALVASGSTALGTWLPLHLLLAGAAATAIAGVMPYFSAAVASAPPAPSALRLFAVVGVALGALLVILGRLYPTAAPISIAGIGGLVYIVGLLAVAAATLQPLRRALGSRRFVVGTIYGVAVLDVICGVALSTLFLFAWAPVVNAWSVLKPAHAWLNLFGFVSLVIAGSLLHLLPTVAGARIARTGASIATFACLAAGPMITALGFAVRLDLVAIAGALLTLIGALALGMHAITVHRKAGHWTTDPHWHRFSTWSLTACVAWFIVGTAVATWTVVTGGATAAGWQLAPLVAPLGIGWVMQALVGSWSHIVPAIGPGTLQQHALQRVTLGRADLARIAALNGAVALMVAGSVLDAQVITTAGVVLAALAIAAAVVLLIVALAQSRQATPAAAV